MAIPDSKPRMDRTTTLTTFLLQTHFAVQSVHLVGSWDNFTRRYPMEKDFRKGRGSWRGCHSFEDIFLDGGIYRTDCKRSGGLKMGGRYWYYYLLDGDLEFHNDGEPSTTYCPFLPGQRVNILEVPIQLATSRQRNRTGSADTTGSAMSAMRTMNPADKYINPRPAPRPPRLRLGSAPPSMLRLVNFSPALSSSLTWPLRSSKGTPDSHPSPTWGRFFPFSRKGSDANQSGRRSGPPTRTASIAKCSAELCCLDRATDLPQYQICKRHRRTQSDAFQSTPMPVSRPPSGGRFRSPTKIAGAQGGLTYDAYQPDGKACGLSQNQMSPPGSSSTHPTTPQGPTRSVPSRPPTGLDPKACVLTAPATDPLVILEDISSQYCQSPVSVCRGSFCWDSSALGIEQAVTSRFSMYSTPPHSVASQKPFDLLDGMASRRTDRTVCEHQLTRSLSPDCPSPSSTAGSRDYFSEDGIDNDIELSLSERREHLEFKYSDGERKPSAFSRQGFEGYSLPADDHGSETTIKKTSRAGLVLPDHDVALRGFDDRHLVRHWEREAAEEVKDPVDHFDDMSYLSDLIARV